MNRPIHLPAASARHTALTAIAFAIAVVIAGSASADAILRCESVNGRREECRFQGGTVQLSQQLGRNACAEGRTWGVSGNTIWVDGGCRADFTIVVRQDDANHGAWNDRRTREGDWERNRRTVSVICESRDGRRHRCAADTLGQVTLGRQLTRESRCVEGRTWGFDRDAIWVDRGCRAEFLIADNGATGRGRGRSQAMQTIVCESTGSSRNYCRADVRFGVRLIRQLGRANCVENRNWGYDRDGIWVRNGCRAEFELGTRQ